MDPITWLLFLLILSAFFSGSETALMTIGNNRIRFLREQKRRGADSLADIRKDKHDLLIAILIGNNLANIGASAMATQAALQAFQDNAIAIAVGTMTLIILLFGEIMPKALAASHGERVALLIAPIYKILLFLMWPLIRLFDFTIHIFKSQKDNPSITEEELKMLVKVGEEEGSINKVEKDLIHKVFKFNEVEVKEVMTPRTKIVTIDGEKTVKEAFAMMARHKFSRIPVEEGEQDNVIGIIYMKDIIENVQKGRKHQNIKVKNLVHKIPVIPETLTIDRIFKQFQNEKNQFAMVVDEYGGLAGIVTLEDLLEEIVGEIYDEGERREVMIKKEGKNTFIIRGSASLTDVNRRLNTSFSEEESYDTFGGHILDMIGHVPKKGEEIDLDDIKIIVQKVSNNHIDQIKVKKKPKKH